MEGKGSIFFWPSFTDLMTSLFFIMLVLFMLTAVKLTYQKRITEKELEAINNIQNAIRQLPEEYFVYDEKFKRFSLVRDIQFEENKSQILRSIDVKLLVDAGKAIENLLEVLQNADRGKDISYMVVIEGMASKSGNRKRNFILSYERALAVYNLWKTYGINLNTENCEIQISGSGEEGIGRDLNNDARNQRILIQIIPKIGQL